MAIATLTWNANTETDLASYKVYRNGALLATVLKGTTSYVDTAPLEGTDSYNLTAVDTSGNESAHSVSVSITINTVPPQAPTGLVVVVT
jgi:large repetitive protein